jgi:hypothetical protein
LNKVTPKHVPEKEFETTNVTYSNGSNLIYLRLQYLNN